MIFSEAEILPNGLAKYSISQAYNCPGHSLLGLWAPSIMKDLVDVLSEVEVEDLSDRVKCLCQMSSLSSRPQTSDLGCTGSTCLMEP